MAKIVELRRHTAADGDVLTTEGIAAAVEIGRRTTATYDLLISSGAQRATQTLACLLAAMERPQPCGVTVEGAFRSAVEERWFDAARQSGGGDLEASRTVDPDLDEKEAGLLGAALGSVFQALPEGGRALIVGHSPMTEVAVLGLTAQSVPPIAKGAGVAVVEDEGRYSVEPLP